MRTRFNTLRPEQNAWNVASYIIKCIFLKKGCCVLIEIFLKFVPNGPNGNESAFIRQWLKTVQISYYLHQHWPRSIMPQLRWNDQQKSLYLSYGLDGPGNRYLPLRTLLWEFWYALIGQHAVLMQVLQLPLSWKGIWKLELFLNLTHSQ